MAYKIWFIFANSPNLKITVRSKLNIVQSETTAEAKLPGLGEKFDVKLDVYLAAPTLKPFETLSLIIAWTIFAFGLRGY